MTELVRLSDDKWINFDKIRSIDWGGWTPAVAKVVWENGNIEIVRDKYALALRTSLNRISNCTKNGFFPEEIYTFCNLRQEIITAAERKVASEFLQQHFHPKNPEDYDECTSIQIKKTKIRREDEAHYTGDGVIVRVVLDWEWQEAGKVDNVNVLVDVSQEGDTIDATVVMIVEGITEL